MMATLDICEKSLVSRKLCATPPYMYMYIVHVNVQVQYMCLSTLPTLTSRGVSDQAFPSLSNFSCLCVTFVGEGLEMRL